MKNKKETKQDVESDDADDDDEVAEDSDEEETWHMHDLTRECV